MSKISIIIPVYNMSKFLRECLDSVINQTLHDIEIICIDDCSTDNSLEILKEYATRDTRIKIIEQEVNQGQGVARNEALKISTGEYIGFVDPDDWIEPNMYEEMYNKAKENNSDIVVCNIEKFYNNSSFIQIVNPISWVAEIDKTIKTNINFNLKNIENISLCKTSDVVWCRIYKKQFIKDNNIRFSKIKIGEDKLFSGLAVILANKIVHINKPFYHWRFYRKQQRKINKEMDVKCVELLNEIYKHNPSEKLKNNIIQYLAKQALEEYLKDLYSKNERIYLYKSLKKYLPYECFIIFKNNLIFYYIKQIFRNILSTKNIVENGTISKYLYLFGLKFKIGEKVFESKTLVAVEREREKSR